jgi:hypothetical protein
MTIPPMTSILARAVELRSDAIHQHDAAGVRQLDSLIIGVACGYNQLCWEYQYLNVASATTPGAIYQVSHSSCTCPAFKPCHHQRLRELLLDMLDTEAETADMGAEPRAIAPRIVAARSLVWGAL